MQRNTEIDKNTFSFFQDQRTNTVQHQLNWYVHRSDAIRGEMIRLWNDGKGITNKRTMTGANADQKKFHAINVLFRNMENHGPYRDEFSNFKNDTKNDMLHCHISENRPTYVVMWEADFEKRIINIVALGAHENFDYKRHHKKKNSIAAAEAERSQDEKYIAHMTRDMRRITR